MTGNFPIALSEPPCHYNRVRCCAILSSMVRSPSLDNVGAGLIYRVGSTATYKKIFRYWYPIMTRGLGQQDDVQFLNWGYEEDPPLGLPLDVV